MTSAADWIRERFGIGVPPVQMPVIESPYLPEGTFIIGPIGGVRMWESDLKLRDAIDWPNGARRRLAADHPLADVVARERAIAFRHLEALLDNACEDLGLDPDVVWRQPRVAEDRARLYRRNSLAFDLESRLALSIHRPSDFAIVTGI